MDDRDKRVTNHFNPTQKGEEVFIVTDYDRRSVWGLDLVQEVYFIDGGVCWYNEFPNITLKEV
jgi:hypothetical protein